jgi:hypothetical protein
MALGDFKLLNLLSAHSETAESENTVGGKESSLLNAQMGPNRELHPAHPRSSRRIRETTVPKKIWWGSSDLAMRGCEDARMPSADKSDNCSRCKHSARPHALVHIPGAKWLAAPFCFCTCSSVQNLGARLLSFQLRRPRRSTTVLPLVRCAVRLSPTSCARSPSENARQNMDPQVRGLEGLEPSPKRALSSLAA